MSIWDIKERLPEKGNKQKRNGALLPDTLRCLIVGLCGCGKSTLIIDNFLLAPVWIDYVNAYIYSRSLNQTKYKKIMTLFDFIGKELNDQFAVFKSSNEEVIPLDECEDNSIVVFDDFILENQNNIREYFTRGRHKELNCFYLSQTYSKVPKQLVRDNLNFLCIFRQDNTNLKHIYNEFVGTDMT